MRIVLNEIKKIFNFKMVCLLILGSLIIYKMFSSFEIEFFPNGRPALDIYKIMVQMIEDYGNDMDEIELEDLKIVYDNKLKEANEFFSNNKDFNDLGIYSYEDYEYKNSSDTVDQKFEDTKWNYLLERKEGNVLWELQELPNIIEFYENRNNRYSVNEGFKKYDERINEIITNRENESILSKIVFDNYNNLIKYFGICIIIGIAFMLTPVFLKDKKDKIDSLQYTSKHGRKLFKSKLVAGVISTLIITTIELIILFILYGGNNTSMFFKSNINSVFNDEFWVNITFIQYIGLTVVGIYVIGVITAFISMFISSKANTYIASIGMQVLSLFIIVGLTVTILLNALFIIYIPKYLAFIIYLALIVITVLIIITSSKKEKITDINNESRI